MSSIFSLSTKAMKLHLTLAGLTLLFPFAAVANDETEWGKNVSPDDLAPEDKGEDRRSRALDQIQPILPTDRKLTDVLLPNDFCDGTPIVRSIPCSGSYDDETFLELLAGFTYTIDVQRTVSTVRSIHFHFSMRLMEPCLLGLMISTLHFPAKAKLALFQTH
jgi:hypothetical protein